MKKTMRCLVLYLCGMLFFSLCSRVIHEQKKPVVTAETVNMGGTVPFGCLYEIDEEKKEGFLYLLEEAAGKRDPFVVRKKAVFLKAKEEAGYLVEAGGISGIQRLVSWCSSPLSDGCAVQLSDRERLEKKGKLIFLNTTGKEMDFEVRFSGIAAEEKRSVKKAAGEQAGNWTVLCFYEDEAAYELPDRLAKLLWSAALFSVFAFILFNDIQKAAGRISGSLEKLYLWECLKAEIIFLLVHLIIWTICIFILFYLAGVFRLADYRFLHAWLPRDRIMDIGHYVKIHEEWKESMQLYLERMPAGANAAEVRKTLDAWRGLGWQCMGIAAGWAASASAVMIHRHHKRKVFSRLRVQKPKY